MSKIYLDTLDKSKSLIKGLRTNQTLAERVGISMNEVDRLEAMVSEGERMNERVDSLRKETSEMVVKANSKLNDIKELTIQLKRIIKRRYDNVQWKDFGILDKR